MNSRRVLTSNFFRVRDPEAYRTWASHLGLSISEGLDAHGESVFSLGVHASDQRNNGWFPNTLSEEETSEDVDVLDELSRHLAPPDCAIFVNSGFSAEGEPRSTTIAVNSAGKYRTVDTGSIYAKAVEDLGADPSRVIRVGASPRSTYQPLGLASPLELKLPYEAVCAALGRKPAPGEYEDIAETWKRRATEACTVVTEVFIEFIKNRADHQRARDAISEEVMRC